MPDRSDLHRTASGAAHAPAFPMNVMRLPRNSSVLLDAPLDLRVLDGTLWLTVDGQPDDDVLEAGAVQHIERGRVIAFALGAPTRFAVRESPATGWRALVGRRGLQALWQRLRTAAAPVAQPTSAGRAP